METKNDNKIETSKVQKSFLCELCNKKFGLYKSLRNHFRHFHLGFGHKCQHCQKSFTSIQTLKVHVNSVHLKINKYKCDICDYRCNQISNLKQHQRNRHYQRLEKGSNSELQCVECGKSFKSQTGLKMHFEAIHSEKTRVLKYKSGK